MIRTVTAAAAGGLLLLSLATCSVAPAAELSDVTPVVTPAGAGLKLELPADGEPVRVAIPAPSPLDQARREFVYEVRVPQGRSLELLTAPGVNPKIKVEREGSLAAVTVARHADPVFLSMAAVAGAESLHAELDPALVAACGPANREVELVAQDLRASDRKTELVQVAASPVARCVKVEVETFVDWSRILIPQESAAVLLDYQLALSDYGSRHTLYVVTRDPFSVAFAPGLPY